MSLLQENSAWIKNIPWNKTDIKNYIRKLFLPVKYFLFQENCSYSETIFLNQDKAPYRKDEKIFLS